MTRPVEPGEIVEGKYQIVRRIGKGGMGVVFEARHATVGRRLAVKFLRADLIMDERRLLRFSREARSCGALHHEHIAAVLDFSTDDFERPYMVMEYVDGFTFRELLERETRLTVQRACDWVSQAARGLAAAHEAGILHRDLKPENLMVTWRADGSDWVKLLDFGVARLTKDVDSVQLTHEGEAPGTPHYLAPEIARGEQAASIGSDIYSLGVVLFELLTGERPHSDGSYNAVLRRIAEDEPPPIRSLRSDLPVALARLVDRVLSRNPAERPKSALEFASALQEAQGGNSSAHGETTLTSPELRRIDAARKTRRPRGALLAGALVLLVLAAAGGTLMRDDRPSPQAAASPSARSGVVPAISEPPPNESPLPLVSVEAGSPEPTPAENPTVHPARTPRVASTQARPSRPAPSVEARMTEAPIPRKMTERKPSNPKGSFDRENPFRR